eukprot:1676336-Rhodomonas_salina.1
MEMEMERERERKRGRGRASARKWVREGETDLVDAAVLVPVAGVFKFVKFALWSLSICAPAAPMSLYKAASEG